MDNNDITFNPLNIQENDNNLSSIRKRNEERLFQALQRNKYKKQEENLDKIREFAKTTSTVMENIEAENPDALTRIQNKANNIGNGTDTLDIAGESAGRMLGSMAEGVENIINSAQAKGAWKNLYYYT